MEPDSAAPSLLTDIVRRAEAVGASDVHLQMRGQSAEVIFRLDGVMTRISELSDSVAERVFGRVKLLGPAKNVPERSTEAAGIQQYQPQNGSQFC